MSSLNYYEIENDCKNFLQTIDHPISGTLEIDSGKWHRFDCPHARCGNKNVAYKVYIDHPPGIQVKCHKCHADVLYHQFEGEFEHLRINTAELKKKRAEDEKEKKIKKEIALKRMQCDWENAKPCDAHPYFEKKHLTITIEDGLRKDIHNQIICPVRKIEGELISTQAIPLVGKKKFKSDCSPKGGFHFFGDIANSETIYFAEGIATAKTIHLATNQATICVYGKHFSDIAPILREHFKDKPFVYCCDVPTPGEAVTSKSNAAKARKLSGGKYCLPDFSAIDESVRPEIARSDFNDLYCLLLAQGKSQEEALAKVGAQVQKCEDGYEMLESNLESLEQNESLVYELLSDIPIKAIEWLWQGKIAKGAFSVIAGHPGIGKSQLTINIASTVSTGGVFPDGTKAKPGTVIILSAEDDPATTLKPRLLAAGADCSKIVIVKSVEVKTKGKKSKKRQFNLQQDLENLNQVIVQLKEKMAEPVSLIIIDPITAYLGKINANDNAEVRGLLATVSEVIQDKQIAFLGISHFTKGDGKDTKALLRVSGSLAFVAAARAAFLVAKDLDNEELRYFLPLKNNLAKDTDGLSYKIESITLEDGTKTSRIAWQFGAITKTADEVLNPRKEDMGEKSALEEACDFLRDLLSHGPVLQSSVKKLAQDSGIAEKTLYRAKNHLNIKSDKERKKDAPWYWFLPPEDGPNSNEILY